MSFPLPSFLNPLKLKELDYSVTEEAIYEIFGLKVVCDIEVNVEPTLDGQGLSIKENYYLEEGSILSHITNIYPSSPFFITLPSMFWVMVVNPEDDSEDEVNYVLNPKLGGIYTSPKGNPVIQSLTLEGVEDVLAQLWVEEKEAAYYEYKKAFKFAFSHYQKVNMN
jgi:hypothetical protein